MASSATARIDTRQAGVNRTVDLELELSSVGEADEQDHMYSKSILHQVSVQQLLWLMEEELVCETWNFILGVHNTVFESYSLYSDIRRANRIHVP